jgi:phosphopantothenoylcysteine decarboxylase / phosphopantothenate---cysteine ligase
MTDDTNPSARKYGHVVVSAGPTREHVDPVRYISNESSGRMGFAIAAAAAKAGHDVTLVAGPVALPTPDGVTRIDVVSAREMLDAVSKAFDTADALIMSAAVCDWRPKDRLEGKWRQKDGGTQTASLDLVCNPDILATVAKDKGGRLVIGFALETGEGMERAKAKLVRKNADFIVLNDPSALSGARASVQIVSADGGVEPLLDQTKDEIARVLIGLFDEHRSD